MQTHAAAQSAPEGDAPQTGAKGGLRALLEKQLHIVGRLAAKAMVMARSLKAQWNAPPAPEGSNQPPKDLGWLCGACAQVSRALRMAGLLKARLAAELRRLTDAEPEYYEGGGLEPVMQGLSPQAWQAQLAWDLFQGLAQDAAKAAVRPEPPRRIREPRYIDPLYHHVMSTPVDELIEEICTHLCLGLDWLSDVAQAWDEAQAAGGASAAASSTPPDATDNARRLDPAGAPRPP